MLFILVIVAVAILKSRLIRYTPVSSTVVDPVPVELSFKEVPSE